MMTLSSDYCWEMEHEVAVAVAAFAKIINSLTSKPCPSFLSAEPLTSSSRKDVNVPFPSARELSVFLEFKPPQDLHLLQRYRVKKKAWCMCASETGHFLN